MQRSIFIALVSAILLLSASSAMAAGDVTQSNEMNGLLRILYQAASEWSPRLQGYALKLLASLALIQLVWTFMPLVMKQADLGEVFGELIRFFMVIGFFYAVIEHSVPWATAVVDSFREAAGTASGLGRALQPGDMFAVAVNFSRTIVEGISLFSPGKAILIALVGFVLGITASQKYPSYIPGVRKLAIENGCGGYNHKTGEFAWEKSLMIENMTLPLLDKSGVGISVKGPRPINKPLTK